VGAVHNGFSAATANDVFLEVRWLGDPHHATVDLDLVRDGAALGRLLHLWGHHSAFNRSDGETLNWAETTLKSVLLGVSSAWKVGNIKGTNWASLRSDGSCLSLSRGDLGLDTFLDWDGSGHSSGGEDGSADGNGFSSETHFEDGGLKRENVGQEEMMRGGEDGSGSKWLLLM